MEFVLSLVDEHQRELRARTEVLCRGRLGELDRQAGETDTVDREIVGCLAREGLLDWTVPGAFGTGNGALEAPDPMSLVSFCLVRETLARHCPNAELIFTMQGLGAGPISFRGNDEPFPSPRCERRARRRLCSDRAAYRLGRGRARSGSASRVRSLRAERSKNAHQHGAGRRFVYRFREDRSGRWQQRHLGIHRRERNSRFRPGQAYRASRAAPDW